MNSMEGIFQGFDIAAAGMRAELLRSEIVSANISNMHSTGNHEREPYRRRTVIFEEVLESAPGLAGDDGLRARGVRVARVVEDRKTPFPARHEPGHPDADENGFVLMSNVNLFKELVDLSVIERSFEANLAAMRAYRTMLQAAVSNIGRS